MTVTDARTMLLLEVLDQAFDRRAWHGTTLRGSMRGLTVEAALWRPDPARHNVWDLILHTAYWKYSVRRRLTGEPSGSFPRGPSNWPALPAELTGAALAADLRLLRREHGALRDAVAAFPATRLGRRAPRSPWTYAQLIHGAAAHDLYHAGQIQLLKRLQG